eukprot:2957620-Amphidinium_carterae.1
MAIGDSTAQTSATTHHQQRTAQGSGTIARPFDKERQECGARWKGLYSAVVKRGVACLQPSVKSSWWDFLSTEQMDCPESSSYRHAACWNPHGHSSSLAALAA